MTQVASSLERIFASEVGEKSWGESCSKLTACNSRMFTVIKWTSDSPDLPIFYWWCSTAIILYFRMTYQHAKINKCQCQVVEDTLSSHPCQFCQNYTNAYVARNSVDGFLHEARLLQMLICPQQKYVKESEDFEIRFCNIYVVNLSYSVAQGVLLKHFGKYHIP